MHRTAHRGRSATHSSPCRPASLSPAAVSRRERPNNNNNTIFYHFLCLKQKKPSRKKHCCKFGPRGIFLAVLDTDVHQNSVADPDRIRLFRTCVLEPEPSFFGSGS